MVDPIESNPRRNLALILITVVVGVALLYQFVLVPLNKPQGGDNLLTLSSGEGAFYHAESTTDVVPPGKTAEWQTVEFPIYWRHRHPDTRHAWYRFPLNREQLNDLLGNQESLGVLIYRLNQTADVWFNGHKIGSGGNTSKPVVRHWNSPLYFTIPRALINERNELQIKHIAPHRWGSMETIVLGANSALKPFYEKRYFIQHDVAIGLFVFVAITGLFCGAIWYYGRRESQYFWYAIASGGSSFYCINQFVRNLWIDADAWRWINNVSVDMWAYACLLFIFRSLAVQLPRIEQMALLYFLAGIPMYFYASYFGVFSINIYFHIGSLILVACAFWVSATHYLRHATPTSALYSAGIFLGLIVGTHDYLIQNIANAGWYGQGLMYQLNLLHMIAPLAFLLLGANLVRQFINSLNVADKLNAELEERISEAREELAENYRLMEDALVEQSATRERERIYRDLHDDVGSKLLSLYYRLEDQASSTLAKSALEDLRDIVSRKSLEKCNLSNAVQQWKQEALARAGDAGIKLLWQFIPGDGDPVMNDSQHAQLRRMLREVLSNAILHNSEITCLDVSIQHDDCSLVVSVKNNGVTNPSTTWQPGRGISNLRHRSLALAGDIRISDHESGIVEVSWTVPLAPTGNNS